MDAGSETAADIGDRPIPIDGRQQPETIHDQTIFPFEQALVLHHIGQADRRAFQQRLDIHQMFPVNLVRSDDQLHLRMLVEIRDQYLLILRPGTPGDQRLTSFPYKPFEFWQLTRLITHVQHTVETGIAVDRHVTDAILPKQFLRTFVLHKQMRKAVQHLSIRNSEPLKEQLVGTEDR